MSYAPEVNGRFSIIDKKDGFVKTIEADRDFMITHNFGAYEENNNTLIFDAIVYDSSDPYTKYPYVADMLVWVAIKTWEWVKIYWSISLFLDYWRYSNSRQ